MNECHSGGHLPRSPTTDHQRRPIRLRSTIRRRRGLLRKRCASSCATLLALSASKSFSVKIIWATTKRICPSTPCHQAARWPYERRRPARSHRSVIVAFISSRSLPKDASRLSNGSRGAAEIQGAERSDASLGSFFRALRFRAWRQGRRQKPRARRQRG
jgi:hypothetical protein